MKNKLAISVIGSLSAALLISSFAFSQDQEKKKARHIKLLKIENGKKMELDTVLTNDDVFVWNGDTINPEKHSNKFGPAEFDKRHPMDGDKRQRKMRIYKYIDGGKGNSLVMDSDSDQDFQVLTEEGDSAHEKIIIRKSLRDGDESENFIYLNGSHGDHFPPMPPVPPVPHIKRMRMTQSDRGINLNDPNVISYKKKDMSGGREKIEIIRKKTNGKENIYMDLDRDQAIDVPEPPMPPDMGNDLNGDVKEKMNMDKKHVEKRIIEKKTEEKPSSDNK